MRSNKLLFLIFLVLYFIAGLSLLITGSVAHRYATKISEITGYSLISGAGFVVALGVIIIVLSVIGFIGAYRGRLALLQLFIGTLLLIILLEFIAAIVAFTLRNKAQNQLRQNLEKSLSDYYKDIETRNEWNYLQQTRSCCGVQEPKDWNTYTHLEPPDSCCANNNCGTPKNSTAYFSQGCYGAAYQLYLKHSKSLGGVSLFFFFVEIAGFILGILLLRDLKNNYGSV